MMSTRGLPLVLGAVLWLVAVGLVSSRRLTNHDELSPEDLFAQQRSRGYRFEGDLHARRNVKKTHQNLLPPRKPNIVLILTDDQDVELGSLNFMPRTLRLLKDEGAEFRHAYVTTPMCCPSRSSLLTGMYVHNHQVFTNNENCSSHQWQAAHETRSFATYLSNAGYRTGYFGKYLNKYNGSYIPPGWREWGGLIMNSRYYNYSINMNGKKIRHGADYQKDYYPDLIANDSVAFLRQSKHLARSKPVMLVVSFPAPHGPEDSAPQFSHLFFNVTTHHTPAYDYAPNPDKQWILQATQRMQPIHRQFTDLLMTKRLQTLQSVDDAVEKIYKELDSLGELDNTYIFYTSDHGYHLGQFGLVKGKSFPFEFDVRVPFLVRGPGIEPGIVVDEIVLNLDVAPTLLDIAGVETPSHMDGRSMLPLLDRKVAARRKKTRWPDTFLIESSGRRETPESGAEGRSRSSSRGQQNRVVMDRNTSEAPATDYADILANVFPVNMTGMFVLSESTLDKIPVLGRPDLQDDNQVVLSAGGLANKVERLALECQKPELRTPCEPGQKWHCVFQGNRWRKHKCKFQSPNIASNLYGSRRRCACYTPAGVMYTRLQPKERRMQRQFLRGHVSKDIKDYRPKFLRTVRTKRSAAEEEVVHALSRRLEKVSKRKRDTLQQVSSIMEDIEEEIHGLQASREQEDVDEEEDPSGQVSVAGGCTVLPSGGVNCSNAVYQDPRAWRSSRKNIEEEIRKLRHQLETLKEIRRHLHSKRPHTSYDASPEEDEDAVTDEDVVDELEDNHRPTAAPPHPRRRKPTTTASPSSSSQPGRRRQKPEKNNTQRTPPTTEDTEQVDNEEKDVKPSILSTPKDHRRRQKHRPGVVVTEATTTTRTTTPEAENDVVTASPVGVIKRKRVEHRKHSPLATLRNATQDGDSYNEDNVESKDVDKETKDTHLEVGSVGPRQNKRKHKHRNSTTPRSVVEESSTRKLDAVTEDQGQTFETSHNIEHETLEGNLDSNEDEEDNDDIDNDEDEEDEDEDDDGEEEYNKFDETLFEDYEDRRASTTESHHRHQHHLLTTARTISPEEESTVDASGVTEHSTSVPNFDNRGPARIDVTVFEPSANANRRPAFLLPDNHEQHTCYCETDEALARREEKEAAKETRRRVKEERLKKKERKLRRKAKLVMECLSEGMNCFTHDNSHWKTEPFWTEGPFCFCMNANNNTYSCIRTINATHNFLYCEFVTGLITFYNLRIDPFEQWNRVHSLTPEELTYLREQLKTLKACKGAQQCTVGSATQPLPTHPYTHTAKFKGKKYSMIGPDTLTPSATQLISHADVSNPNKKRKKLTKPWRRRKAWQNQWRQRERRRRYRQFYQQRREKHPE